MTKRYFLWGGLVVIVAILFLLFRPYASVANYPPKNDVIVAFGDSLIKGVGATEGNDFVSLLAQKINRPIINMGTSGETTGQGLLRINEPLSKNPGTVILLLLGGNDHLQKVPKEETFSNLRQIITKFQESRALVVLLGMRGGLLNDSFKSDFENLASETHVVYVPDVLDGLFGDARYMSDAVHPNDIGYAMVAEKVYGAVKGYLQ